jgi:hypothetical protein
MFPGLQDQGKLNSPLSEGFGIAIKLKEGCWDDWLDQHEGE